MHKTRLLSGLATVGLLFMSGHAYAGVVYDAPNSVFGGYCPTCAGTATQLGDDISLAGGPATLTGMTWDTSNYGSDYQADITLDLYNVDTSGTTPSLGSIFHSQTTQHFLAGGNGDPARTFVDIPIASVNAPERFVYSISVDNNNGSTNWNVAGSLAKNEADEDPSAAEAAVGTNNELDYFWGDWVSEFNADPTSLTLSRLDMAAYQLGLPQNADYANYSYVTPNVSFEAADVPAPATIALLMAGLVGVGFAGRRQNG